MCLLAVVRSTQSYVIIKALVRQRKARGIVCICGSTHTKYCEHCPSCPGAHNFIYPCSCSYVPADEPAMSDLLSLVVEVLEGAVMGAALPPWPPAAVGACPVAEVGAYFGLKLENAIGRNVSKHAAGRKPRFSFHEMNFKWVPILFVAVCPRSYMPLRCVLRARLRKWLCLHVLCHRLCWHRAR